LPGIESELRPFAEFCPKDAAGETGMAEGNVRHPTACNMHAHRKHSGSTYFAGDFFRAKISVNSREHGMGCDADPWYEFGSW
jgi:hypothetical protein